MKQDVQKNMWLEWAKLERKRQTEQTLFNVLSGIDWLVKNAQSGEIETSQFQELKDNIKILEAKCNG